MAVLREIGVGAATVRVRSGPPPYVELVLQFGQERMRVELPAAAARIWATALLEGAADCEAIAGAAPRGPAQ